MVIKFRSVFATVTFHTPEEGLLLQLNRILRHLLFSRFYNIIDICCPFASSLSQVVASLNLLRNALNDNKAFIYNRAILTRIRFLWDRRRTSWWKCMNHYENFHTII